MSDQKAREIYMKEYKKEHGEYFTPTHFGDIFIHTDTCCHCGKTRKSYMKTRPEKREIK
jgi:hypothetical protein